jgi:hypothetical protein
MNKPNDSKETAIDCFRCRHFYVTWEVNQPRGCKAFGFKTSRMPSLVVLEASGAPCLKFSPKAMPKKGQKKPKKGWVV